MFAFYLIKFYSELNSILHFIIINFEYKRKNKKFSKQGKI